MEKENNLTSFKGTVLPLILVTAVCGVMVGANVFKEELKEAASDKVADMFMAPYEKELDGLYEGNEIPFVVTGKEVQQESTVTSEGTLYYMHVELDNVGYRLKVTEDIYDGYKEGQIINLKEHTKDVRYFIYGEDVLVENIENQI